MMGLRQGSSDCRSGGIGGDSKRVLWDVFGVRRGAVAVPVGFPGGAEVGVWIQKDGGAVVRRGSLSGRACVMGRGSGRGVGGRGKWDGGGDMHGL